MDNYQHQVYEYGIGDILGIAWDIFSKNFVNILLLILVVSLPTFLLLQLFPVEAFLPNNEILENMQLEENLTQGLQGLFIIISNLGIIFLAKNYLEGQESNFNDALRKGLSKFFPWLFSSILMAVFLFGLMLLLFIPAIIFGVYWVFMIPVIVFKDKAGLNALKESKAVVKGRWWMVLGYSIVFAILVGIPIAIFQFSEAMFGLFDDSFSGTIIQFILNTIVFLFSSYSVLLTAVFYHNLDQTRKDNPSLINPIYQN